MSQLLYVCFTLNNPQEELVFDPEKMSYLIYQLELSPSGTPHFQGYMELEKKMRLNAIKRLLGSNSVHIERRQGTAQEAADYCRKEDTYVEGGSRFEYGEMRDVQPGKRNDLAEFKDLVMSGQKRKRELCDSHPGIMARYPRFYENLTLCTRPVRTSPLEVILHIGDTGLGKTRTVMDAHLQDQSFYIAPLSNSTFWYDHYDQHETVLLDDFSGSSSHMSLVTLLRLLDRYPVMVPVKGAHVWWLPNRIYVTTNILPKDWYKWEGRPQQYRALERRFTKVVLFYPKLHEDDPGFVEQDPDWWRENAPVEALKYYD